MAITLGNDISRWQGDVNFDTFKNNTQFVIIKATEGNGFTDPKFKRNQTESRRVGLLLGYYHFARPDLGNTPEAEADYFLAIIGDLRENELLALDYECPNQVQAHVDWCRKFLDRIYSKTKVRPFIYLNQAQCKNFDWQKVIDGSFGLWLAAYTYDPNNNTVSMGKFPSMAMQQWSNKQSVPGTSGGIDGNVFFGTIETLKKYGYKKPVVVPPPQPPAPTPVVVEDDGTRIKLGTIGGVDYQTKSLLEVKEMIKSRDSRIKQDGITLGERETKITELITQVNDLTGQVGVFTTLRESIKKFLGL